MGRLDPGQRCTLYRSANQADVLRSVCVPLLRENGKVAALGSGLARTSLAQKTPSLPNRTAWSWKMCMRWAHIGPNKTNSGTNANFPGVAGVMFGFVTPTWSLIVYPIVSESFSSLLIWKDYVSCKAIELISRGRSHQESRGVLNQELSLHHEPRTTIWCLGYS